MMRSIRGTVVVGLLLAMVSPALASDESERLYSRGLVDFHAGQYAPALAWFDRAVRADPADGYARYYRAVTRARAADISGAIDDLRAVMKVSPRPPAAGLELGVILLEAERYEEAERYLKGAEAALAEPSRAAFFLGLAQLRQGKLDDADASLRRAAQDISLQVTANYYRGVIAAQRGQIRRAVDLFEEVAEARPDSEIGAAATAFLAALRGPETSRFALYGQTGFQYDSNVGLIADDAPPLQDANGSFIDANPDADGRVVFRVGADYHVVREAGTSLVVGYDFFQNVHFNEHEFNLQRHRPSARLAGDLGPAQLGVVADYEYSLLETDSFLSQWQIFPWVAIPLQNWGRSEVYYRWRQRSFKQLRYDALTGTNNAAGLRQLFFLDGPNRFVSVGYRFDREDARDGAFGYDGHEVSAGVQWDLPWLIWGQFGYTYRGEQYRSESKSSGAPEDTRARRHDDEHNLGLSAWRSFGDYVTVDLGYFVTLNESNKNDSFEYDRRIVSLTVRVDL
jgi:tetratricopeptide (TPR) repeat protein